tara:strand:+ start:1151 stop:1687 length:537 start_codon:yes stop_codon:yes gene_type:complete
MAESFVNALSKSAGIVTTSPNCSVGAGATLISGISTVNLGVGYLVNNQHFRGGTKIVSIDSPTQVTVDRASTNTSDVNQQPVSFLGPTAAYTSPAATKSILIGGTFANLTNNNINITVEVVTGVTSTTIANDIPVPTGSSFVISDAGKTVMTGGDVINIYADTVNSVDVTLGILQGVN